LFGETIMILDTLQHFNYYLAVHPLLEPVYRFLQTEAWTKFPAGKRELGNNITCNISEYQTKEAALKFIECHCRFIDLQIMVDGSETIGFCHRDDCRVLEPYNDEKDFEKLSGTCDFLILKKGNFALFFPQDAHMPGLWIENRAASVKKMVFKIPVIGA
jgi:YhcH/YjgK/YiaL family protein